MTPRLCPEFLEKEALLAPGQKGHQLQLET